MEHSPFNLKQSIHFSSNLLSSSHYRRIRTPIPPQPFFIFSYSTNLHSNWFQLGNQHKSTLHSLFIQFIYLIPSNPMFVAFHGCFFMAFSRWRKQPVAPAAPWCCVAWKLSPCCSNSWVIPRCTWRGSSGPARCARALEGMGSGTRCMAVPPWRWAWWMMVMVGCPFLAQKKRGTRHVMSGKAAICCNFSAWFDSLRPQFRIFQLDMFDHQRVAMEMGMELEG